MGKINTMFEHKLSKFSSPSVIIYVLCALKNRLIERFILSTNNICFGKEIRKIFFNYTLLTRGKLSMGLVLLCSYPLHWRSTHYAGYARA